MEKQSIPRNEYPRPCLVRNDSTWECLNGKWDFETDSEGISNKGTLRKNNEYRYRINVPFVPESKLSGIGHTDFMPSVWYRRIIEMKTGLDTSKERVLLHIGAADYETFVWIDGNFIGSHKGGYTPFYFDITNFIKNDRKQYTLTVNCVDNTCDPLQPSGKQSMEQNNSGCMYTRSTGIWQPVWLEYVPVSYIKNVKITPDPKNEKAFIEITISDPVPDKKIKLRILFDKKTVSYIESDFAGTTAKIEADIPDPVLWDIGKPDLYDVEISYIYDNITTYFGMRSVETSGRSFILNGRSVFMRLLLDQGYYPDGIYTAPCAEDIKHDIELEMLAGFNGARMHMKIFEPLYTYYADHLGFILWGEYPNWGIDLSRNGAAEAVIPEWTEEINRDYNRPSIIGWCPFNETNPGDSQTVKNVFEITRLLDRTRPVIDSSGYCHVSESTDIFDVHDYTQDPDELRKHYDTDGSPDGRIYSNGKNEFEYDHQKPLFISEFGGIYWNIENKCDDPGSDQANGWGYGLSPVSEEQFLARFDKLCSVLLDDPGICGFCYTQFTDVMQEKNGLFSFDRYPKFSIEKIRKIVSKKAAIEMKDESRLNSK